MALAIAALCAAPARSDPITFCQFLQTATDSEPFVYTNNGSSATLSVSSFAVTMIVDSAFLPPGTNPLQAGTLRLTSSTTASAAQSGGNLVESFPATTNTLQILLSNPINGSTDFLTATFSGHLIGAAGGSTVGLNASRSAGDSVNYSSGILNLTGTRDDGFALSFGAVTPRLELGAGNFFGSFTASGTGSFQVEQTAPEPASAVLFGALVAVLMGAGLCNQKVRRSLVC
jgi:hypothetical protein